MQLIKADLKYRLQAKRKASTGDSSSGETPTSCKQFKKDIDSSDDDIDLKSPKCNVSVSIYIFFFHCNQ